MAKIRLQGEEEKRKNIYYEVDTSDKPIGEGGMGRVMKGIRVDVATGVTRPVAIKFLFDGLPEHAIERARREASIQLRNDNLIEMLGFIELETKQGDKIVKHYHVVSELLHGVSLSDIFEGKTEGADGKPIPFAQKMLKDYQTDSVHFAKFIVKNVLSGLLALHDAGYIHRDIDPSNIMLTDDGHVKLIDFGISKQMSKLTTNDKALTTAGVFMGKAEYAAPELAIGDLKHQNQTTDIYAMGILLYVCITGHAPFEGPSHIVLDEQLRKKIPLGPIKDRGLRKIIETATEKNQGLRYQTAAEMRVALEALDGQMRKMKSSVKMAIIGGIAAVVIIVVGIVGYGQYESKVEAEQQELKAKATNDSLAHQIKELAKTSAVSLSTGEKHDEGYEDALIDAYNGYSEAISDAKRMTENKPDVKSLEAGRKKAKEALLKAKEEFQAKAKTFSSEGMPDVANEFQQRSDKITSTIK